MASELSVVIKVSSRNKNFRWDNLRNSWKNAFGGEISKPTQLKSKLRYVWSFSWQNVDSKKVLEQAEKGNLDKDIVSEGGAQLLEIVENEECIYQFIPEINLRQKVPIREVESKRLKELAVDVLLITATEIERKTVLAAMAPWPQQGAILQGPRGLIDYSFGQFGNYRAAHCRCTMGSGGRSGSAATTSDAIKELKPKAILILGIAFGIDPKKQRFGDVIIADSVFPYSARKQTSDGTLYRGIMTKCGTILSLRFGNYISSWKPKYRNKLLVTGARTVTAEQGSILSGDELINNKEVRDKLLEPFEKMDKPANPLGGEMEGAGAYEARERLEAKLNKRFEIILIKAICDWADGNKNNCAQPFAAYSAVSLAKHVLSKPDVLAHVDATDISLASKVNTPPNGKVDSRYKSIINALKRGSIVPFLGPGINPNFYMNLAFQFTEFVKQELLKEGKLINQYEEYNSQREELIRRLIGIPCSVCNYWLLERPGECPIIKGIKRATDSPLDREQELEVSKINLQYFSHYYILKHDPATLHATLDDILGKIECKDSKALHNFLANLPSFMRSKGYPTHSLGMPYLPYQLIVTTNYDNMLEEAFLATDQLFDVVFYVADGDDRGKFKHRTYEGDVQIIDTVDYNKLPLCPPLGHADKPRPIILKLFGTWELPWENNFVITEQQLHFLIDSLARSLPNSLIRILRQRSNILFMGYSPSDTDLHSIVRCLWPSTKIRNKSWLIHQAQPGYLGEEIWENRNVGLIKIPSLLDEFVTQLKGEIESKIPVSEEMIK